MLSCSCLLPHLRQRLTSIRLAALAGDRHRLIPSGRRREPRTFSSTANFILSGATMLQLKNVKKSFAEPGGGRLPILDIPQLEVGVGEQVVLVGRSGCGKTTLLHIIAGIIRPDSGVVPIDDLDIARLPEAARDRLRADKLGYVFQTFNLLPGFSALGKRAAGNGVRQPACRHAPRDASAWSASAWAIGSTIGRA